MEIAVLSSLFAEIGKVNLDRTSTMKEMNTQSENMLNISK